MGEWRRLWSQIGLVFQSLACHLRCFVFLGKSLNLSESVSVFKMGQWWVLWEFNEIAHAEELRKQQMIKKANSLFLVWTSSVPAVYPQLLLNPISKFALPRGPLPLLFLLLPKCPYSLPTRVSWGRRD